MCFKGFIWCFVGDVGEECCEFLFLYIVIIYGGEVVFFEYLSCSYEVIVGLEVCGMCSFVVVVFEYVFESLYCE